MAINSHFTVLLTTKKDRANYPHPQGGAFAKLAHSLLLAQRQLPVMPLFRRAAGALQDARESFEKVLRRTWGLPEPPTPGRDDIRQKGGPPAGPVRCS